ncbi:Acyl-CoA synthetase (AMP-forming)/AMP-acid ligase II [uncultured Desulfobacterium sp.]|uniref:Acyl-CoA synthetase (AMP-forming)/AMP-acid ligase II n=1 Tax=uncultured Desulfobacterium sp. TaxID=201089 RepID=A0A445MXX0_9BACT|nr:Acyl-CoA synthetase (AMP-forming)/AMP-acid ligase II [uncultured Desulfobacterium sp.]
MTLGDMLRRNARIYPTKTSLVYDGERFTWRGTLARVNALTRALLGIGVKKGDRIAILSDNSHRYLEIYLAAAQAGFIIVPLNSMLTPAELNGLVLNAEPVVLFCGKGYLEKKNHLKSGCPCIRHFIGLEDHDCNYDYEDLIRNSSTQDIYSDIGPDDIFSISYTSGTTGNPKGAALTHRACYMAAIIHSLEWRVTPADNYLFLGRLFFAAGGSKFIPFFRGCKIVVTGFEPAGTLELIERERISTFSTGPTIINSLVTHPDVSRYRLDSIRSIGYTSAPMPAAIWQKANQVLGEVGVSTYGLTETNATGLILHPEDVYPLDNELRQKRLGSVGKAMALMDIRVIDPEGVDVDWGKGEICEIIIKGQTLTAGYWNNPSESAKTIKDGWFYTGDLATIDEDGYIYIVDRKKDIIISGGINISSREVEEVLYQHQAVGEAAVIGVPDQKWGETVKAVIQLNDSFSVTEKELIDFCRSRLASYKKPTSIDFVRDLPRTSSGKINRRLVREKYW